MNRVVALISQTEGSSEAFDAAWYLERYPDVKQLGMDPLEHYQRIGKALGRSAFGTASKSPTAVRIDASAHTQADVLFVDGANGTASTTYRVNHVTRGMRQLGWSVVVVRGDRLEPLLNEKIDAKVVVFFRSPLWYPYREFAEKMRKQGAVIVCDTDDFVFDETVMRHMDGVRFLSAEDVENYRKGIRAYRDFVVYSDLCTLSTSALVDEVKRLGRPAFRVRNTISAGNVERFSRAAPHRSGRPSPFVVGYYSGTKTHQADFAVVADALVQFMARHEDVYFRLVGQFELGEFPALDAYRSRIIRVDLMPHDAMLRDQLSCDVIIAPLEVANPFCEAKSELKFFEAALVGCPVIASATRTFREATREGLFAHLAATPQEWSDAFEKVYGDYESAQLMASRAHEYVCREYGEEVAAREALDAYDWFRKNRGTPAAVRRENEGAQIGVIITDVIIGSGGHRKVFRICHELEQQGYTVAIYVVYSERPEKVIRDEIRNYFYPIDAQVIHFRGSIGRHSHVICTHWATAYEMRKIASDARVLYFVQDFEPMFCAVGSDYMRALATYSLNFTTVCYGKWVAARLADEVGISPHAIPFTLDHRVYAEQSAERPREIDVLFFARPSQERRCFALIVEGLRALKAVRPATRIGFFGENSYPDTGFEFTNFGLITDGAALADLYRRTKVGICFSTTNPSQLGYEMIACGAVLLDVRTKFCELNFDGDDFVKYCTGTPESIAQSCVQLLDDGRELERRRVRGREFASRMADDDTLGRSFLKIAGLQRTEGM